MNEKTSSNHPPFETLGTHLKYLREKAHESLHEVSGAVELESTAMERIESGHERPSEEILLLLIQHYNMADQEAGQLWELAGYDNFGNPEASQPRPEDIAAALQSKQLVLLMAMDMRTMYSDGLDVNLTPTGLSLNFTQMTHQNQRVPVARVGMSYEQARQVLKTLEEALLKAKYMNHPIGLPAPKPKDNSDKDLK